jgi:hypothetical protein
MKQSTSKPTEATISKDNASFKEISVEKCVKVMTEAEIRGNYRCFMRADIAQKEATDEYVGFLDTCPAQFEHL